MNNETNKLLREILAKVDRLSASNMVFVEGRLKRADVQLMVGFEKTKLLDMVSAGAFPAPYPDATGTNYWLLSEVQAWIAEWKRDAEARRDAEAD